MKLFGSNKKPPLLIPQEVTEVKTFEVIQPENRWIRREEISLGIAGVLFGKDKLLAVNYGVIAPKTQEEAIDRALGIYGPSTPWKSQSTSRLASPYWRTAAADCISESYLLELLEEVEPLPSEVDNNSVNMRPATVSAIRDSETFVPFIRPALPEHGRTPLDDSYFD